MYGCYELAGSLACIDLWHWLQIFLFRSNGFYYWICS